MGISYIDQIQVVWYGLLAAISTASVVGPKRQSTQVQTVVRSKVPNWVPQVVEVDTNTENDTIETGALTCPARQRFLAL